MTRQTHTLAEVAEAYLPPEWTDGVRWLRRKLNSGQFKGVKMGRTWMMTPANIEFMLTTLGNDDKIVEPESEPKATEPKGISFSEALSPRSRSRLRTVTK